MELLARPGACSRMVQRQKQLINGEAAEDICKFIIQKDMETVT